MRTTLLISALLFAYGYGYRQGASDMLDYLNTPKIVVYNSKIWV